MKKVTQYIAHQKYIERKVLKRRHKGRKPFSNRKHPFARFPLAKAFTPSSASKVLKTLESTDFAIKNLPPRSGTVRMYVPECFCFSKNPDETIKFLRTLYTHLMNPQVNNIHFNHFGCTYIGVGASTVMDVILMECIKWRRKANLPINISGDKKEGQISSNTEVDLLVKMSGLIRHLNIANLSSQNIEQLPIITNGSSHTVATDVIQYIDRSLARHGVMLTKLGQNYFGTFLGEIIDNCAIHGGDNAVWYTLGHYSYDEETQLGKCKLTIIDFGNTIYESLKYHSNNDILKKINHYVKRNWISTKSISNEETLYTLFSLQQRVSRIANKGEIRGNGTVTFIENIMKLFNTTNPDCRSTFSITSGRCSILFDGTYTPSNVEYQTGYSNKIIAFNAANSLYDSPDPNYVRTIENGFPGTILSMDLYIDNQYIERS